MSVAPHQRFTASSPCPVCGGHGALPSGRGVRCWGFLSADGSWAHCSRDEHAGSLPLDRARTYAHCLVGPCGCGQRHEQGHQPDRGRNGLASAKRTRAERVTWTGPAVEHEIRDVDKTLVAIHRRRPFVNEDGGHGKDMKWFGPDWTPGLNGRAVTSLPLFGAETLAALRDGAAVVVCEGEKAARALQDIGVPAVGTVTGAKGVPDRAVLAVLTRLRVLVWPDNDGDGHRHGEALARELIALGTSPRVIEWADAPPRGDAADFIAGKTRDDARAGVLALAQAAKVATVAEPVAGPDAETWGARAPLPPASAPVPDLTPEMVPGPLRAWGVENGRRASIPLCYTAIPAVVAVGAVVGRAVGVRPKRFDDWLVVANFWGTLIGPSGWLKTHAATEGMRPLRRLAARAHEQYEAARDEQEAERERIEAQVEALKAGMRAAAKKGQSLVEMQQEMARLKGELRAAAATERRYVTQDATVEKLVELLRENPRGLLILRDEIGGWLRALEREGHEGDREFYLESWNGDGSFTSDRIGRGTVVAPALTLSVFGGIQPGKLAAYVNEAIAGGSGADGLLQRLQLAVWPDALGEWNEVTDWPKKELRDRVNRLFEQLDGLSVGDAADEDGGIPALRFAPDAQALFDAWFAKLEGRIRSGEFAATPAFESHVSKYRSLMPALALLFHLIDAADQSADGPVGAIGLDATKLGAAWVEFLELHARKIYAAELRPGVAAARALAAKIEAGAVRHEQAVRDVYRAQWSGLASPGAVEAALPLLIEANWLRVETRDTGGRPTEVLLLHPDLRGPDGA